MCAAGGPSPAPSALLAGENAIPSSINGGRRQAYPLFGATRLAVANPYGCRHEACSKWRSPYSASSGTLGVASSRKHVAKLQETQIDAERKAERMFDRLVDTTGTSVVAAYERRVRELGERRR